MCSVVVIIELRQLPIRRTLSYNNYPYVQAMWEVGFWKIADNEFCVVNGFYTFDEAHAWLRKFLSKDRPDLQLDLAHIPFCIRTGLELESEDSSSESSLELESEDSSSEALL